MNNVTKFEKSRTSKPLLKTEAELIRAKKLHKTKRGQNAKGAFLKCDNDRYANTFEFNDRTLFND